MSLTKKKKKYSFNLHALAGTLYTITILRVYIQQYENCSHLLKLKSQKHSVISCTLNVTKCERHLGFMSIQTGRVRTSLFQMHLYEEGMSIFQHRGDS